MSQIKKMWIADNGDGTYRNPILYTDYSDPDVIRVGEDYYMTASSFCNTPALPVLHSKDLVNWKVISYGLEKLPFSHYQIPQHGKGVWAPAIRYHEGTFYIFFPMPDEGIFQVHTTDPFKGWSEPVCVRKVTGWIDPCPFWDDDGNAYMVSAFARSRIGFKSILHLSRIKADCSGVLDDGRHVFDGTKTEPTIEGPKLYKRNGYYYIFAPAGGVKPGWQVVLRSKNIWGPFEEKKVLAQGNTPINGPHQGAWVDTPSGENWFIHFQDVGAAGRIIHLQPMRWVDDWPVMGINEVDGCGEPVLQYQKPDVGRNYPIEAPEDSDFFEGDRLGLQWQWNANYREDWYDLDTDKKQLILYTQYVKEKLNDVPNLLLQKWPAPRFIITTRLFLSKLVEGDLAGMISLGRSYASLAVKNEFGVKKIVYIKGNEKEQESYECGSLHGNSITIKMQVADDYVSFAYSTDEKEWINAGDRTLAEAGVWVGVKTGLYAVNEMEKTNGKLIVDDYIYHELDA